MEASPTPGRAARAGAPEIQPACSWEGERGHRHVCMCGCAHVCRNAHVERVCAHVERHTCVLDACMYTNEECKFLRVSTQYV